MNIPRHVAFIMDGNRRWAKSHGITLLGGHAAGKDRIEPLVVYAAKRNISTLTFWAFSSENWNRGETEVSFLMTLFREGLEDDIINRLLAQGVRVQVFGDLDMFPSDIVVLVKQLIEKSRNNNKITVNFALNYGGRKEILRAVNALLQKGVPEADETLFSSELYTAGQHDPDLIIRTGGAQRLSGFFPWQGVYSELYFTDVYWPDFTEREFEKALEEYMQRERRFGR